MSRLIDADEFKKLLLKERDAIPKLIFDGYDFGVGRRNHDGDLIRAGIRKALRCMEQTPTIEAEPVRHGRWERYADDKFIGYGADGKIKYRKVYRYECDCCRRETAVKSNYCPNCGCKMGGGAE